MTSLVDTPRRTDRVCLHYERKCVKISQDVAAVVTWEPIP